MVPTAHEQRGGALRHLWTWVQAVGLVYLIGFGMVRLALPSCSRFRTLELIAPAFWLRRFRARLDALTTDTPPLRWKETRR